MKKIYLLINLVLSFCLTISLSAQIQNNNVFHIPDVTAAYHKTAVLPVYLDNTSDIVGLQFTIEVPSGMFLTTGDLPIDNRGEDHVVSVREIENCKYICMLYSPTNKALKGYTGKLFEMEFTINESLELGSTYPLTLSDVVLGDIDADNVMTSFNIGELLVINGPDLIVTDIVTQEQELSPYGTVNVAWNVKNDGGMPTTGGWKEQISLVNNNGESLFLGTTYYDGVLSEGDQISRAVSFILPQIIGLDGDARIQVKVIPNADAGETQSNAGNNTTIGNDAVYVKKVLFVEFPKTAIGEEMTSLIRCKLLRSGSWMHEETFTLSKSADNRMEIPTTLNVPEGQSATYFYIQIYDNDILDNDSIVNINISGNDYDDINTQLVIVDNEYPDLSVTSSKFEITEGETFQLNIVAGRASHKDEILSISCNRHEHFIYPKEVIMPAGNETVSVDITAIEDELPNVTLDAFFEIKSPRYNSGECDVELSDNDMPEISLSLTPNTVAESSGPMAVFAVLKRLTHNDNKVTINLSDNSDGRLYYPKQTIVLDKGINEVQFAIGIIDNTIVDGDMEFDVTASIYISSCNCSATGTSSGVVTQTIKVTDDDGPSLRLTSSKSMLLEGAEKATVLTVSRNTNADEELTVTLSSNADDLLLYEKNIIIPAGKTSVNVDVATRSDHDSSESHTVVFTAQADNYSNGTCWVMITDQTLPDAVITELSISSNEVIVGDHVNVSVTAGNEGIVTMTAPIKVSLYFSNTNKELTSFYIQDDIAPGETTSITKQITLPDVVGNYNLYATINESHNIDELLYINNTSEYVPLTILPAFTATLSTDKSTYIQDEEVVINGEITGKNTANAEVEVYIIDGGLRQTISVTTDDEGKFSTVWKPYRGQTGYYSIGACYPKENLRKELTGINIYGLKRYSNSYIQCDTHIDQPYSGNVTLNNPCRLPLTDVRVEVLSAPEHCNVECQLQNEIAGGSNATLSFTVSSNKESSGTEYEKIILRVTTAENASIDITLYHYCFSYRASLKSNVSSINTTMVKGTSREYSFTITNLGKGATGKISLSLPQNISWMKTVTPMEMPSLEYGETANVVLLLTPTDDMQLNNPLTGTIGINCENGNGIPLYYRIEPVSETTGTLTVDVRDEYTYYTDEAPHVAGANVIIRHPVTKAIITEGVTDNNGKFTVELPEGYYTINTTETNHTSDERNILLDPGVENNVVINLTFTAIEVGFGVEEIEIEDEYTITTTLKYETNVPMPVVELSMPQSIPAKELEDGESLIFNATLTNRGLITAQDAELLLPEEFSTMVFEPLVEYTGLSIAPQESIIIPIKVTRTLSRNANIDNDPCVGQPGTLYFWDCGLDRKWHRYGIALQVGSCNSNDPSTWDNPGNGGYGGHGGHGWNGINLPSLPTVPTDIEIVTGDSIQETPLVTINSKGCNPCQNQFIINATLCASSVLSSLFGLNLLSCGLGVAGCLTGDFSSWRGATGCALAVLGCFPGVGTISSIIGCFISLTTPCNNRSGQSEPSYITKFREVSSIALMKFNAYNDLFLEIFGDSTWITETNNEELYELLSTLIMSENTSYSVNDYIYLKPEAISYSEFETFIERLNNSEIMENGGNVDSDNYINNDKIEQCFEQIEEAEELSKSMGYNSVEEMWETESALVSEKIQESQSSVCSSISLQFSQKITMTRQAFRGTLTVFNGHESLPMENVKLSLDIRDEYGTLATSHEFEVKAEKIDGFEGELSLNAGWSLSAKETGTATVLFIPTKYAAPTNEMEYSFGGTISYLDPFTGTEVTRDLYPVTLTVKPSPNLEMNYFMQRDIIGDDPLTDIVEPMQPAEFSLLINNIGYGDATNVRIMTQEPEIIDNEKGLLIDFELLSSQLNGGEHTLTLGSSVPVDFGNIAAHSTAYAQWWLKSSLLGHFTEYDISVNHVTGNGNDDLSLLDTVAIHELIRSIKIQSEDNLLTGFLVNDIVDINDLPDMLYLTDGTIETVCVTSSASITKNNETQYTLSVSPLQNGWNYGSLSDPTLSRMKIVSIIRQSDGTEIDTHNFWQTDRTLRDGKDPLYESRIHFIDKFTAENESYLLTFEVVPELVICVDEFTGVHNVVNMLDSALEDVNVHFNKPIDATTFTTDDLSLSCQGKPLDASQIVITSISDREFKLDISAVTENNGYYVLTVQTSEITDQEGFNGESGKNTSWVQYLGGKVNLIINILPDEAGEVSHSSGPYDYEEVLALSATAHNGYTFKKWSVNDEVKTTETTYNLLLNDDIVIDARFQPKNYHVDVICDSVKGMLTGAGTGIYQYGDIMNLAVEPAYGYDFVGWYLYNDKVSDIQSYNHPVDSTATIEARFIQTIFKHSISLHKGWNWFSTYLEIDGQNGMNMIKKSMGYKAEQIKSQHAFSEYVNGNWYGKLETAHTGEMYMTKVSNNHIFNIEGRMVNPDEHPIILEPKWTWIGYVLDRNMTLEEGLANFTPSHGDFIKSYYGFSIYVDDSGWIGTCKNFEVGQGYMYKNNTGHNKTLFYPSTNAKEQHVNITQDERYWSVDLNKYPTNMSIIAIVNVDGENVSDYEIGAFCNGECRGSARPIYIDLIDKYMIFLTIYGENDENIHFRYYDIGTGIELDNNTNSIAYSVDGILGNMTEPYILNFSGFGDNSNSIPYIYPNPVNKNSEIHLGTTCDNVTITNSIGMKIAEYNNVSSIDGIEIPGVYIINVVNKNGNMYYRLIVK